MAPPTPSPRRFLPGHQRGPSPTKDSKPPSSLRQQLPRDDIAQQQKATPSQFAATPRFSSKPRQTGEPRERSPPKPSLVDALRATARVREDVEDASVYPSVDEEMLDDEQAQAMATTEVHGHPSEDYELPYSPKRRRIADTGPEDDGHGALLTSIKQSGQQLKAPVPHTAKPTPRFASPPTSHNAAVAYGGSQHRPAFLRSSIAPPEPSEPLPEAFSPHRRGQKFVPGGMAATVQQWVIETGQAAVQSRRGQAYLRGDDFVVRVMADSVEGSGPLILKGHLANGDDVSVLLIQTAGGQAGDVVVGSVMGIRAPIWEVYTRGQRWVVGVDWKQTA